MNDFDAGEFNKLRLDLTPLVDVIFLLLIFFMVSTTFKEDEGIELNLPEASASAQSAEDEKDLRVSLKKDGQIVFRGETLQPDGLETAARAALKDSDDSMFIVEADAASEHGSVVAVMDALRRAGAKGLTIGTQPRATQ